MTVQSSITACFGLARWTTVAPVLVANAEEAALAPQESKLAAVASITDMDAKR
jgi:hypothetical protein